MKNRKKSNSYSGLVILIVGLALFGGLAIVQTYDKGTGVVIENQTVNGDFLVEDEGDVIEVEEDLGLTNINVSATGLTNLRVGGKRCFGSSSSTGIYHCQQEDVETWPTATTSLAFRNNRSTTSTLERLIFDMSDSTTGGPSSSIMLSCGTSTLEAVAYNAALNITPRNIFSREAITTGTVLTFDSLIHSSSTVNLNDPRTRGQTGTVLVGPNEYVSCTMQAYYLANGVCDRNGVECEAVTSTNRRWSATLRAVWGWVEGN